MVNKVLRFLKGKQASSSCQSNLDSNDEVKSQDDNENHMRLSNSD